MSAKKTEISTTEEIETEDYYYKVEFQQTIIESGNDWLDHQVSESIYIGDNGLGYEQVVLDRTASTTHNVYDEDGSLHHSTGRSFQKQYVENQTSDGVDYTSQHEHYHGNVSESHILFKATQNIFHNDTHSTLQIREVTNKNVNMTMYHQNVEGENTLVRTFEHGDYIINI